MSRRKGVSGKGCCLLQVRQACWTKLERCSLPHHQSFPCSIAELPCMLHNGKTSPLS